MNIQDPSRQPAACDPSVHGFFELPFGMVPKSRVVALTFDDGPDARGCTDRVLDILAEKKAPGCFFVNACNQEAKGAHPRLDVASVTLRRMRDEGHEIGNHTASHPELKDLSCEAIVAEMDTLDRFVGEALGEPSLRLSLMRTPYGRPMYPHDRRDAPATFAKVAGCLAHRSLHVGWTMDTNDWQDKTAQQVVADALALVDASDNGGILLMHSILPRTCEALPAIIDGLRARGFALSSCEALVQERYGQDSKELVAGGTKQYILGSQGSEGVRVAARN